MPLPGCGLEAGRCRPCRARALAPAHASLAGRAPGAAVPAAGAGHHRHLPVGHAACAVRRLERRGAPAGGRLCRPAGRRHRLAARRGARPGAGAAPAVVGAHRRARGALGFASAAPRLASRARRCARRGPLAAQPQQRRRPPHRLRPGRPRLGDAAARHRLGHAGGAAAAHRRGLWLRAPPVPTAGRHPRRRAALRPGAFRRRRSRCAGATSWATWPSRSTPWRATSAACSMPSAACCWR